MMLSLALVGGWPALSVTLELDRANVRRDATVQAVEEVLPSVVNIATATVVEYPDFYSPLLREFYGWGNRTPRERLNSIGSGVVINEDGWVLTNLHVVRRASRIQVKMWDGQVYEAEPFVLGQDYIAIGTEHSDVALVKLKLPEGVKLKAIQFAPEDDLMLGETVLALGNPFGLGGTVTRGILSSKNRRPSTGEEPLDYQDWLQTDAAINPGNSGGPLINLNGELIGLNVAVYREGQGIGFAIPIRQVNEALSHFFTPEISHGLWFGARLKREGSALSIVSAQQGSPAFKAGLREGQRILSVNGTQPHSVIDFNELLCRDPDKENQLRVEQNGTESTVGIQMPTLEELVSRKLGLALVPLSAGAEPGFRRGAQRGLYVTSVEQGGPADQAGFKEGFVVTGVGDQEAGDVLSLARLLASREPGDRVAVRIREARKVRGGYLQFDNMVPVVLR